MFKVEDLVSEAVKEENENRKQEVNNRVKALVNNIILYQSDINLISQKLIKAKAELKELRPAEEFKLEL